MTVIINGREYVPKPVMRQVDNGSFGQSLKSFRKAEKLSLETAAKKIGCSKSYLWGMENDASEPSFRMAVAIASAYGVPLAGLAACLGIG